MKRFVVCLSTPQRTPLLGRDSAFTKILEALNKQFDLDDGTEIHIQSVKQKCKLVMINLDSEIHNSESELSSDFRKILSSIVEDIVAMEI